MNSFDENAFFLLVWRAILVALVGAVLLVTHPFALDVALLAAGNIALVFSVVLMACAASLTEDRIVRSEAWRLLAPAERPFGVGGRQPEPRRRDTAARLPRPAIASPALLPFAKSQRRERRPSTGPKTATPARGHHPSAACPENRAAPLARNSPSPATAAATVARLPPAKMAWGTSFDCLRRRRFAACAR